MVYIDDYSFYFLGFQLKKHSIFYFGIIILLVLFTSSFYVKINNIKQDFTSINESENFNYLGKINSSGISNFTEFETFLDSYIPDHFIGYNITGMTISIVENDEMVFAKGYGSRSLYPTVKPVIANQTLFRVGSISKTFVAVAVLQLVEDGILDLDTDINNYLTMFQIPNTYQEPITLKHLLTHSAGFEEFAYNSLIPSLVYMPTLQEVVSIAIPERVHPPGIITSYSNYGLTLAGYIVQEISGELFEDYIENEILIPLGMNQSSFKQPLPTSSMRLNMSDGFDDGRSGSFEYVTVPPAGAFSATSTDMAKFMIALLNNGTFNGNKILQNETIQMMQEVHFITHPNLPGVNLGLYEMLANDEHVIGHGGDTYYFHSRMALFPERKLGIFMSYNSRGGVYAKSALYSDILNRYFPRQNKIVIPMQDYDKGLIKYGGYYCTTRRFYSDKVINTPYSYEAQNVTIKERDFLDDGFEIKSKKGYLEMNILGGFQFVQVEPDYFVESTGHYDLSFAFIRNENNEITNLYINFGNPAVSYEKVHPIYENYEGLSYVVFTIGVIFFVSIIAWGIIYLIRTKKGQEINPIPLIVAKWLSVGVLIFSSISIIIVVVKSYSTILLDFEILSDLGGLIVFPIIDLLLIAGMFIFSVLSWFGIGNNDKIPYWKLWERILYSILTLFSSIFIITFALWGMLG